MQYRRNIKGDIFFGFISNVYNNNMSTPSTDHQSQSVNLNNDRSSLRDPPLDATEHIWM